MLVYVKNEAFNRKAFFGIKAKNGQGRYALNEKKERKVWNG